MSNHTPGPWEANGNAVHKRVSKHYATCIALCEGEQRYDNAKLIALAPELLEALLIAKECGCPEKFSMYDEEGIEGWLWTHDDGREWSAMGDWAEEAPPHPVISEAITKVLGDE